MNDRIKLVLYFSTDLSKILSQDIMKDSAFDVIVDTSNADTAMKYVQKHENVIVLLDCVFYTFQQNENFVLFLKNEKISSIAICKDAQIGFEFLKIGISETIISNEALMTGQKKLLFIGSLCTRIKVLNKTVLNPKQRVLKKKVFYPSNKIIAIGASTGGTEATTKLLKDLPADIPPIVVVQHMPPVFTKMYADRLNEVTNLTVWEAIDGDRCVPGLVLIAPGDMHMSLHKDEGGYFVKCFEGDKVSGHCPSVDVLFSSISKCADRNAIGVIMTGMGADGAKGLLEMRNKGSYTIGQNKESCIVYGMPQKAFELGAVCVEMPIENIAKEIINKIYN